MYRDGWQVSEWRRQAFHIRIAFYGRSHRDVGKLKNGNHPGPGVLFFGFG